jgi:large subunit ribosomal protein L35
MNSKLKFKTKKGVAKRFKITGKNKIKRRCAYKSHLLSKKSSKRKRKLSKTKIVSGSEKKHLKKLLGI